MTLEMKQQCQKCGSGTPDMDLAYICSHECTFCAECSGEMDYICPNCAGELVKRPTEAPKK